MDFPTLYKKTSTGAIQMWRTWTEGDTLFTEYGQVDGKKQTTSERISGVNIGKSNETTPVEQAINEARSRWEKKSKKHYVTDPSAAANGEVDETFVQGGMAPMLAQVYSKHGGKIKFPAFVQPKLDGHRCIAVIRDGVCTLWTRTQKPITGVPHINAEIESMDLPDGTILDGELYNHDYRDRFEELTSFIRNPNPKLGYEAVQYHVYDLADDPRGFEMRHFELYAITKHEYTDEPVILGEYDHVKRVDTHYVDSEEEMFEWFAEYREQGYEGLMVRNADGKYVNKRSYDLQKVKEFDDAEFTVVGVEQGRGKLAGKAVFICQTASGDMFNVKMAGSLDNLSQYWEKPELAIGRKLTVQFQGFTNAANVPRFPVGLRFRDEA